MLEALLRLLHPVIPFVTEELWTALTGGDGGDRAVAGAAARRAPGPDRHDPAAEAEITALMRLVTEVRRFRSDQGLRPAGSVPPRSLAWPPAPCPATR